MVVIRYGDYFMGYSNLGSCTVKKGDHVKAGDLIAYVGKDLDERYGIDFILRDKGGELDATSWFSQPVPALTHQ
jgi:septal ring factor EnvC (AmiA/AmiB activator)